MDGVFRDYVLFASLFIGTLHAEGKLDDHGKTYLFLFYSLDPYLVAFQTNSEDNDRDSNRSLLPFQPHYT
jgi:hypothetical protein